jgi:signal transduction histidine kinase/PAS domain-containing protein
VSDIAGPAAAALVAALDVDAPLGAGVFDADLRCRVASPSLLAISGASADYGGRPAGELVPESIAEVIVDALTAVRDGPSTALPFPRLSAGPQDATYRAGCYRLAGTDEPLTALLIADVTARVRTERHIRENRERLARAEQLAGVGAWTWWPEEERWRWSDHLLRMLGREPGTDVAPDYPVWLEMLAGEDRPLALAARDRARAGDHVDLLVRQRRADGARRILRIMAAPHTSGGRVTRVDGLVQDVTDAERFVAQQQAVAELTAAALEGGPPNALMDRVTTLVGATLDIDFVTVLEAQSSGTLEIHSAYGWPGLRLDTPDRIVPAHSQAGHTVLTREPVVVEDWATETRFPRTPLMVEAGIASGICVPIEQGETLYGALAAYSPQIRGVRPDDVPFLLAVANLLGSAVQRHRLEQELTAQAEARGRLVAHALDAEDRTRREISETLHDGPLQDVLALHQHVARLEPRDAQEAMYLARALDGLRHAIAGLREVMLELHPVVLEVGGLESALGAVAAQQGQLGGFEAVVHVEPDTGGPRDELVVSLARELLVNAAKHSGARRVDVAVRRAGAELVLEVSDDGRGIPEGRLPAALREGHIGLASTRQRVEAVGGSVELGDRPGGGTRVTAAIPAADTP